jgi:hypothetical protein
MAMRTDAGLAALRDLRPEEFWQPVNQNVAKAILDLASEGRPHDAAAVSEELRRRPMSGAGAATQLPYELDPRKSPRRVNPAAYGLGAWETVTLGAATRAPVLAREVRSLYRQDRMAAAAHQAVRQYRSGLQRDGGGALESDQLGEVTLTLAQQLTQMPKELHPEFRHDTERSVAVWDSRPTTPVSSATISLPSPPTLSPAGRNALRR